MGRRFIVSEVKNRALCRLGKKLKKMQQRSLLVDKIAHQVDPRQTTFGLQSRALAVVT
jgi:hypothetical protein